MELMYLVTNVDTHADGNIESVLTETKVFVNLSDAKTEVQKRLQYYKDEGYVVEDERVYLDYNEEDGSSESWFDVLLKEVPIVR